MAESPQVQQRRLQTELTDHERSDHQQGYRQQYGQLQGGCLGKRAAAVDQPAKAQHRQHDRQQIDTWPRDLDQGDFQVTEHQQDSHQHQRHGQQEQPAPAEVVNDEARDRGTQCRGRAEHHGHQPHDLAASLGRIDGQRGIHQQRHGERRRHGLHQPPRQQQSERGCRRADQRSRQEGAQRDQREPPGIKPLHQAGGQRRQRPHHQQKARGHPLHGGLFHRELPHQRGQGHVEQGLVQKADEGPDEQRADDQRAGKGRVVVKVLVLAG